MINCNSISMVTITYFHLMVGENVPRDFLSPFTGNTNSARSLACHLDRRFQILRFLAIEKVDQRAANDKARFKL